MRARLGHGVDEYVTGRRSINLGAMLARELLRDPYSHTFASVAGYSHVPAPEDVSFLNWVDARALMAWQSGKVRPQPAKRPWLTREQPTRMSAPDPQRHARRAELNRRLGITP